MKVKGGIVMKFKILFFLAVCVLGGCFNLNNTCVSAAGTNNLCLDTGVKVTWSGTWLTAGSEGIDNPGTNLIDGDYTNKWGSYDIRVTGEEWVQISFGKAVNIGGFLVYQEASGAYTNIAKYTIQVQNQSETWVDVYTSGALDELWSEDSHDFPAPIKATAFRFLVKSDQALPGTISPAGQCAIELSEIEIYEFVSASSTTNVVAGNSTSSSTPANTSTAKSSATQVKANSTNAKAPTSSPSTDKKDGNILLVPIIIGAVVVAAGAIAAFIIIKNKKS